ncbi:hypothetical protein I5P64_05840 [Serratia ureilytica]|uniref:hypothetical protein n=1 Tax=Serratia TaxID=613 RepID=UPI0018D672B7|nr:MULTISPECIES: hypothetical protein [Serratia]MBH2662543.1 hypothetical protein [Serratia ureilytica]MDP8753894.1 hypothetical protein [Serratia marcescens]MDP8758555.1 hypothetical protein [Serratia marcescens]MDP8768296.1 hypothetical protein [Serratia marcescens]MDP8878400.1 hypothetical protein [Serratia marcescens]
MRTSQEILSSMSPEMRARAISAIADVMSFAQTLVTIPSQAALSGKEASRACPDKK